MDASEAELSRAEMSVKLQTAPGSYSNLRPKSVDTTTLNRTAYAVNKSQSQDRMKMEMRSFEQVGGIQSPVEDWRLSDDSWKLLDCPPLGRGQFGVVLRAEWGGTDVAVKVLHNTDSDSEAVDQLHLFENELRVMRELHHPLIIQFLGYGLSAELGLMIFMEYLPNGSVQNYTTRYSYKISKGLRRKWADQMTQALVYLHNRKPNALMHRDIKPANFMLTPSLICKLGDFGICKMFENVKAEPSSPKTPIETRSSQPVLDSTPNPIRKSVTWSSDREGSKYARKSATNNESEFEKTSNVGTVRYMAPEVSTHTTDMPQRRTKYDVQAGIFSVGMVFFFIFENRAPAIAGANDPRKHFAALKQGMVPTFLRTDRQLRGIVLSCLNLDPKRRPVAKELLVLLRSFDNSTCSCFGSQKTESQKEYEAQAKVIYERLDTTITRS